jgi:hypothetical protein
MSHVLPPFGDAVIFMVLAVLLLAGKRKERKSGLIIFILKIAKGK